MNKLISQKYSLLSLSFFIVMIFLIVLTPNGLLWANEQIVQASGATTQAQQNKKAEYAGKDWTLTSLKGDSITLSDYQGKPVILVFWATWCPYCKKLLPGIEKLHQKYAAKGLKIIAVNIKENWKPEVYWRNHGYTFDAVLLGDQVAEIYGVRGTPGIVFIETSGKVLGVQTFSDPDHPLLEKFAKSFTD